MTLSAIYPWWREDDRGRHWLARDADTPLIALPAGLADPNRGAPTFACGALSDVARNITKSELHSL